MNALFSNTTGYYNSAIGVNALFSNTTGDSNSAIGTAALRNNTTGTNNSVIGVSALYSNTTGYYNSAFGANAGRYIDGGGANETGNNSLFLGYDARAHADGETNQIVIGSEAIGLGSNTVVLGNDSIVTTALRGNVGIGTTSPDQKLDILDTSNPQMRLTHTDATDYADFQVDTDGYLTITPSGNQMTVAGDFLPSVDDTYDLGATGSRWADLYLGGETIHIGSSVADEATISYTSSNILSFDTDSTTNGDIAFFTDDLYLDKSNGYIGVGTNTPGQFSSWSINANRIGLEITGTGNDSSSSDGALVLSNNRPTAAEGDFIGHIYFGSHANSGAAGASISAELEGTDIGFGYGAALRFKTKSDLGALNGERMRISGSGYVGIGTTSPTQKLDIAGGSLRLDDTTYANQDGVIYKDSTPFIHNFNYGNNGTVTTDGQNTFIGENAGNFTMGADATETYHASYNTGIGQNALNANTTGDSNSAIGVGALYSNTTGHQNSAIGINAGRYIDGGGANETGNNSLFLGYDTRAHADGETNQIVIGASAIGLGSNTVVLGNDSIVTTALKGDVGIGTTSPDQRLDILDTSNPQVRLTHTDGSVYTDFQTDSSGYLLVTPSGERMIVTGHIIPAGTSGTYDLGADGSRFGELYLDGETIHIGESTTDEGTIAYSASNILSFDTDSTTNGDIAFFTDDLYLDKSNGYVGVGTTSPSAMLDIYGTGNALRLSYDSSNYTELSVDSGGALAFSGSGTTDSGFLIEQGSSNEGYLSFGSTFGSSGYGIRDNDGTLEFKNSAGTWAAIGMSIGGSVTSATSGSVLFADASGQLAQDNSNFFWDDTNDYLGLGDTTPDVELDVVGDINYTGSITDVSDIRLKENIMPLENALEKLLTLEGFTYTLKQSAEGYDGRVQIGFSAQNVQEVFPEAVSTIDEEGHLGLDYTQLVAPAIEAIKELHAAREADRLSFESRFESLDLITDENASTIETLRISVNEQLTIVGDALTVLGEETDSLDTRLTALDSRVLATESDIADLVSTTNEHDVRLIALEEEVATLRDQNTALFDFYQTFEMDRFVSTDEFGNVDLLDGTLSAGILEAEVLCLEDVCVNRDQLAAMLAGVDPALALSIDGEEAESGERGRESASATDDLDGSESETSSFVSWDEEMDTEWVGDYLMVMDEDVYDSDDVATYEVAYAVDFSGEVPIAKTTISFATTDDSAGLDRITTVRVFMPEGSWLTAVGGNDSDPIFGSFGGKKYVETDVRISADSGQEVTLEYDLPENFLSFPYTLKVEAQSGVDPFPFSFSLIDADGIVKNRSVTIEDFLIYP